MTVNCCIYSYLVQLSLVKFCFFCIFLLSITFCGEIKLCISSSSMWSRVRVTVSCTSVRLSVPSIDSSSGMRFAAERGHVLRISIDFCRRPHSAANVGGVMS